MENLVLTRIDDRLIHGQVMTAWIKNKKATQVVIVDDLVAEDDYMIEVLEMAIPEEIAIGIFNREDGVTFFSQGLDEPTILLVKGPEVLNYLVDHGINIEAEWEQEMEGVYYTKIFLPVQKKMISLRHY